MKKMKLFLGVVFVAFSLFFVACTGTSKVQLTVSPLDVTAAPGETIEFTAILTPDVINGGSLGAFTITDSAGTELYSHTFSGVSSDSVKYSYTVAASATLGTEIFLTFTATDGVSNNNATATAVITVGTDTPILVDAKDKQAVFTTTTLSDNFLFALGSDAVTMVDGNSNDGDLAFVWNNDPDYQYSIVSPDSQWITELYSFNGITYDHASKKNTKIMMYAGGKAWADITADDINNLTVVSETTQNAGDDGNGVQNLSQGDIVVYETEDGRKGALLVKTNAKATKNMTVDLKYQATSSGSTK